MTSFLFLILPALCSAHTLLKPEGSYDPRVGVVCRETFDGVPLIGVQWEGDHRIVVFPPEWEFIPVPDQEDGEVGQLRSAAQGNHGGAGAVSVGEPSGIPGRSDQ